MKLSAFQQNVLKRIDRPHSENESNHPQDAYRRKTLDKLKELGLVEYYYYNRFLHGAVRITKQGKDIIS